MQDDTLATVAAGGYALFNTRTRARHEDKVRDNLSPSIATRLAFAWALLFPKRSWSRDQAPLTAAKL